MKRLEVAALALTLTGFLCVPPAIAQDDTPADSATDSTMVSSPDSTVVSAPDSTMVESPDSTTAAPPMAATEESSERPRRFAVGVYGFYEWPIVQDDAEPGGFYGGKAKYRVAPKLDLEFSMSWLKSGDGETESGGTIPAPDIMVSQFNASLLMMGPLLQLTGGLGWASIDTESAGSVSKFAWNFGLAVEIPVGPLSIDLSPRLIVINTESGASRKFAAAMAGLNFRF